MNLIRLAETASAKDLADMIVEMVEQHPHPEQVLDAVNRQVNLRRRESETR